MIAKYEFKVYRASFQELMGEARERAERLFGYPPPQEAFTRFDVRVFAEALGAQPSIYEADVCVEMDFA